MSLTKLYDRIDFTNDTTPALNETNLNLMSKAIDDIDDRVVDLGDDVLEVVPEIQTYLDEAEALLEQMETYSLNPPYIGANNDWYTYDVESAGFVDSGVSSLGNGIASIELTSTSGLVDTYTITFDDSQTTTFTVTNGAQGETGNGISSVALTSGTHAAGTLDTYTITFTDGTTSTFQVYNGADGSGTGDMTVATYDPDSEVADAGGIPTYVARTVLYGSVTNVASATATTDGTADLSVTSGGVVSTVSTAVCGWDKLVGAWTSTVTGAVGATTVSFTNPYSTASVAVDPFCENTSGTPVAITAQTVTSSTITLTFAELTESTDFKCLVRDLS